MEDETCMEYLFRCVLNDHPKDIDQNILFNASNEFRNLWNLVKKLRELARVDVQKITRFLDAVQEALEKNSWSGAAIQCLQAKSEYKQIRRYIRPSFLEDFKVARFIVETSVKSKSGTKKDNKPSISSGNQHRRQNFRNKQINNQSEATGTGKSVTQKSNKEKTVTKQSKETDSTEKTADKEKSCTDTLDLGNQEKHDKFKTKHTRTDVKPKDVTQGKAHYRGNRKLDTNSTKVTELVENVSIEKHIDKNDQSQNVFITKVKDDGLGEHTAPIASFSEIDKSENNKNEVKKEIEELANNNKVTSVKRECSERNCEVINSKTVGEKVSNNSKIESSDTSLEIDSQSLSQNTQNELQNTNRANDLHSFKHNDKARKEEVASSRSIDISSLVSGRQTEMNYDCNADEIIAELKSIYETEWTIAYKALTGCTPSNGMKNTIDFLGEILKVAAQKVKIIPENDHAFSSTGNVTSSLTEQLGNIKKDFLKLHLKELQAEHSIEYASGTDGELSVNIYSAKCVELAWFMYTRQPPMTFDYDSRPMLLEDLFEIFKPYKNKGNCLHYIVWPAIRRYAGGTVVAQGIAEFR